METVSEVAKSGLCTGCGTCAAACPEKAIEMRRSDCEGLYLPVIEQRKCKLCRTCVGVCPGHELDFEGLNSAFFKRQPNNRALGNYRSCHIGHSRERNTRYESASGGLASQILIFAFERGIIDGALVVRMRKDKPLEAEAFIARTKEEILDAAGSKYCPVAANQALKSILTTKGRFAIVGLPCHIHGIRKAEKVFKGLEQKIVLHIGLMCAHTVNFKGTEFLLEKMHIGKDSVREISYRGKGWPGVLTVKTENCSSYSIPYSHRWSAYWSVFSCFFFAPMRCLSCPDQTNELSDISLGDAWLPDLRNERLGESVIIARTQVGSDLLRSMNSAGVLCLRGLDSEKVEQTQHLSLKSKKDDFGARLRILKLAGKHIPQIKPEPNVSSSPISLVRTSLIYMNTRLSYSERFARLSVRVPFSFFRLYFGIYAFLMSL